MVTANRRGVFLLILFCAWGRFPHSLAAEKSDLPKLDGESQYQNFAPDGIPFVVADSAWTADQFGNHRAVVFYEGTADQQAVVADLPWRRPDLNPQTKKIIVVEARTNKPIRNVLVNEITPEHGRIVFEPVAEASEYYIYYLPYTYRKGWGDARYGTPWNDYLPAVYAQDTSWLKALPDNLDPLPQAEVIRFESRSRFDYFTPMGLIATHSEKEALKRSNPKGPILFTEDRAFPTKLTNTISSRWAKRGPAAKFRGYASRNEYYVWQIGVWAAHEGLKSVKLEFSDFVNGRHRIASEEVTCFNQEGVNWTGDSVFFTVDVPQDQVQALWCGIQVPEHAGKGIYKGTVKLSAEGVPAQEILVEIEVTGDVLDDHGDGDLWRHARLRWLNSRIGMNDLPVKPYDPMTVDGNVIGATGKQVALSANGLPNAITINKREVLAHPFVFVVELENKNEVVFDASNLSVEKNDEGLVSWRATSSQNGIDFTCTGAMEYDGYISFRIRVSTRSPTAVNDIKLVSPYTSYASAYFMGIGFKGGTRPQRHHWKWDGPYDSFWMGNADAGLHMEYRGGAYHGPLLNDYKPAPPAEWANNGNGMISLAEISDKRVDVVASTGKDTLSAVAKDFEFALLITPVKPVDEALQFSQRYYHANPTGFDKAGEEGANIANIHHGQPLNPVINYPFTVRDELTDFIDDQHGKNRKVKLYYTIRELTNHATEIYALKSLNGEIFETGVGFGSPWHMEHLIDGYRPAWYSDLPGEASDAALVLSGFSRWINYYLEGLRWMLQNYHIDGVYMDDVSFDRNVMKRMRKIMEEYRPGSLIDLHSNTGYSIGPANQYADFFPYVDRLWFGESFKYNEMSPDEWLVTFSGIPFGQMSEMLQDGGNRFLGMVYGTTGRHSYSRYSPAPVWKLWESFGIGDADMIGYWDERCPVQTDDADVKATAFVKNRDVLVAIGNFADEEKTIALMIDWAALGMDPDDARIAKPPVENFQRTETIYIGDKLVIPAKEGVVLRITESLTESKGQSKKEAE